MGQYRGNSAGERRLERRERLLKAACNVYGERGFHGATVKAICDEAGLTERYFYENFPNGTDLFIALHKETSERIISSLGVAANSAGKGDKRIRALLLALYTDIQRDPVLAYLLYVDAGHISPAAKEVCNSWRSSFGLLLAQSYGSDPETTVRNAVARAVLGIGVDWMDANFPRPVDEIIDAAMTITSILEKRLSRSAASVRAGGKTVLALG